MVIGPVADVSALSIEQLYELYLQIAERDHRLRLQALYGATPPPPGHWEFRPLSRLTFTQRVRQYDQLPGGVGLALRQRLARQAGAYGVDCPAEMHRPRQAA